MHSRPCLGPLDPWFRVRARSRRSRPGQVYCWEGALQLLFNKLCLKIIDHGCRSTWGPGPSRSCFWAHYSDPKQGLGCIYSLNCATRWKLYKTKVVGKVCFSGSRAYFWARNLDLEGPEPHVLLEPWSVIFRRSLLNKRCSTLELTFLATFCPHNTLNYFNIMTRATPGRPS